MRTTIWFDMDGTIADLYGVENWLEYLISGDPLPYKIAKPLIKLNVLARLLNRLQREGFQLGIISWLAKTSTTEYDEKVTAAKEKWLKVHMKSVQWDEIKIVPYGTPKQDFAKTESDVLFDDEEQNRIEWTGQAFDVKNIIEVLKGM